MKIITLLILTFLCNCLYGQNLYERTELIPENLDDREIFKIEDLQLSFTYSPDYDFIYLNEKHLSDDDFLVIDTVEYSPYPLQIYSYKSSNFMDFAILWVTEFEYDSDIHAFYYANNKLSKVGVFPIQGMCETCDDQVYSIELIKGNGNENVIEFDFLVPVRVKNTSSEWEEYQPGEIKFILEKETRSFKSTSANKRYK